MRAMPAVQENVRVRVTSLSVQWWTPVKEHSCSAVVGNTAVRLPGVKTEKIMTFKSPRMDAGHETIYLLSPRAASSLV